MTSPADREKISRRDFLKVAAAVGAAVGVAVTVAPSLLKYIGAKQQSPVALEPGVIDPTAAVNTATNTSVPSATSTLTPEATPTNTPETLSLDGEMKLTDFLNGGHDNLLRREREALKNMPADQVPELGLTPIGTLSNGMGSINMRLTMRDKSAPVMLLSNTNIRDIGGDVNRVVQ